MITIEKQIDNILGGGLSFIDREGYFWALIHYQTLKDTYGLNNLVHFCEDPSWAIDDIYKTRKQNHENVIKICNIINNNKALSLTSPSNYIRELAKMIFTKSEENNED